MSEKLFTIEMDNDQSRIHIHLNDEGIDELVAILGRLKKSNKKNHDHLMTPSWAGTELTEAKMDKSSILINQATIHIWK